MQITNLNKAQLAHFVKNGCVTKNQCYANCAKIVYALSLGNYVICQISDNGVMVGHAVIEHGGKYYDPTLQNNASISSKYRFVKSFSRSELVSLMKSEGGVFDGNGEFRGYPPALMSDGSIKCVNVQL